MLISPWAISGKTIFRTWARKNEFAKPNNDQNNKKKNVMELSRPTNIFPQKLRASDNVFGPKLSPTVLSLCPNWKSCRQQLHISNSIVNWPIAHLSLPLSISWVALSFLVCCHSLLLIPMHSGSLWLTLVLSSSLWLSQALIFSQGPCSACYIVAA